MCDPSTVGLDVFVGTLTRYYSGDWELITQRLAREMGLPLRVVRQNDQSHAVRDPEQIRPAVLSWRESLSIALVDQLSAPLDWDEREEAPYFTDKPAGTGLGLPTTYSIVRRHDGHITVGSRPGEGATFHVYLPRAANGGRALTLQLGSAAVLAAALRVWKARNRKRQQLRRCQRGSQ